MMKRVSSTEVVVVALAWSILGCSGWGGLWADIPDYQGPRDPDASVGPDASADAGPDASPDTTPELLDAPANLAGAGSPEGVTLTWEPVDGASGYEVKVGDDEWVDVGDVTTWVDADAPLGSFDGDLVVTAADGLFGYKIPLEVTTAPAVVAPAEQTYEVRARDGSSSSVMAARTVGEESWTWQVAPAAGGDFEALEGVEGREGEYVADMPGLAFRFKATLEQAGVAGSVESGEEGGEGSKAVQVSMGFGFTCVLLDSGRVVCWGGREDGRLGDGEPLYVFDPDIPPVSSLIAVETQERFVKLAETKDLTIEHTCGLTAEGEVFCWGKNDTGQLANGSTLASSSPVRIELGEERATDIVVGDEVSCALMEDLSYRCWGAGTPAVWTARLQGYKGVYFESFKDLCALTMAGQVECFDHEGGALVPAFFGLAFTKEDGSDTSWDDFFNRGNFCGREGETISCNYEMVNNFVVPDRSWNVEPAFTGPVDEFEVGFNYACVVSSGTTQCWGDNKDGLVGNGMMLGGDNTVVDAGLVVGLGGGVVSLDIESRRACAVDGQGILRCWGSGFVYPTVDQERFGAPVEGLQLSASRPIPY